ncbi:hypothetical protein [Candidatus Berkiella aquae]|uniref:Leucine Rich repeats (2 copies) n=1 Tax=Candidatus Berkiella aquae TaxID=295108 RepID=A0A0Q9YZD7_9GAMM|nr:hypothetical protein [Candidatus Berkiella aquae]MCS5711522.1 hypothetical protein [Candidatus Berkiella aquae]
MLNQWTASRAKGNNCFLAEHCNTSQELQQQVTKNEYRCIVLNSNSLSDMDLQYLCYLNYLENLSIADVEIKGSCLAVLLNIPGLKSLDISHNSSLEHHLMLQNLIEHMPRNSLERLDASDNFFDYLTLHQLIILAFYCAKNGFKQLTLGKLDYLSKEEIRLLSVLINKLSVNSPDIKIESTTLNEHQIGKRLASSCSMEAMKGYSY